jgi:hypothetical protein
MVEAAQHRRRDNGAVPSALAWHGTPQGERAVRAMMVVVEGELREHCAEMPLVEHNHVIETFAANRADKPSAIELALGARAGVLTAAIPRRLTRTSKSRP